MRGRWSVVLERKVRELQGQAYMGFGDMAPAKKEIASSRSFGQPVTQLADVIQALSDFDSHVAKKLKRWKSRAGHVLCFIHASGCDHKQHSPAMALLSCPSLDTAALEHSALQGVRAICWPGAKYAKASVILLDLEDGSVEGRQMQTKWKVTRSSGRHPT